jgi:hypothetical protein
MRNLWKIFISGKLNLKIEDDILREVVEEDKSKAIHKIINNEKSSTS